MTKIAALQQDGYDPGRLLTHLVQVLQLKNEIALSKTLRVSNGLLRAIREQKLAIAGAILIQMHEVSKLSINELRSLMGDRRRTCRMSVILL